MSYKIFQRLLQAASNNKVVDARNWFRQQAKTINVAPTSIINKYPTTANNIRSVARPMGDSVIGNLTLFAYDPKHKDTLPFYDKYPLIFVTDISSRSFMGINFHYLDYRYRAILMDNLYALRSETMTKDNYANLSYRLLKTTSSLKYYRPCIKRYLNSQVTTKFVSIPYEQWDIALFLPLERFEKQTKQEVHQYSKKVING
jgi:hypothetical protein